MWEMLQLMLLAKTQENLLVVGEVTILQKENN
jgi:hypothetical protein